MQKAILIEVINMTRKEEITKKIEQLEVDLCATDKNYDYYATQVELYLEKKIKLNEQINDLKEELQELENENLIAPLNSAIATLKNYCESRNNECSNCLLYDFCYKHSYKEEPYKWVKIG